MDNVKQHFWISVDEDGRIGFWTERPTKNKNGKYVGSAFAPKFHLGRLYTASAVEYQSKTSVNR